MDVRVGLWRRLSSEELMLLNCGVGEDSWESLGLQSIYMCVYMYVYINVYIHAAAAAKLLQLCLTLCDPIDGSSPGSSVPGTLQARTLEWIALSFSKAWKWKVKVKLLSCVWLLVTPWTVAHQAPLSMGFSRQEYWRWVPLPSPVYIHTPS